MMSLINFGQRLRGLRILNGIAQRELSRRASVPNSAISVIKSNEVSPSIDSMTRILGGFPIPLMDSFFYKKERSKKFHYRKQDMIEMTDGSMTFRMIGTETKIARLIPQHPPNFQVV